MPDLYCSACRALTVAVALLGLALVTSSTTTYLIAAVAGLACSAVATCALVTQRMSCG